MSKVVKKCSVDGYRTHDLEETVCPMDFEPLKYWCDDCQWLEGPEDCRCADLSGLTGELDAARSSGDIGRALTAARELVQQKPGNAEFPRLVAALEQAGNELRTCRRRCSRLGRRLLLIPCTPRREDVQRAQDSLARTQTAFGNAGLSSTALDALAERVAKMRRRCESGRGGGRSLVWRILRGLFYLLTLGMLPGRLRTAVLGVLLIVASAAGFLVYQYYDARSRVADLGGTYVVSMDGTRRSEAVDLSGTAAGDEDLKRLLWFVNLEVLGLADTQISDSGLQRLKYAWQLRELDLSGTRVTDGCQAHLQTCTRLKTLKLARTAASDALVIAMEEALPGLRVTGVDRNPALRAQHALRKQGARLALDAGGNVLRVDMSGLRPGRDELAQLESLPRLQNLDLSQTAVTDDDLESLRGCTSLQELILAETRVGDEGLAHLESLTKLKSLDLSRLEVTGTGLGHLAPLSDLTSLTLDKTSLADAQLAALAGLTHLEALSLADTSVGDAAAAHLSRLATLQELNLSGTRITAAGLAELGSLPQLAVLRLDRCEVSLAQALRWFQDRGTGVSQALRALDAAGLDAYDRVAQLQVSRLRVTDECLRYLAGQGLDELQWVTGIDLSGTQISEAGLAEVPLFLNLRSLNLAATGVGDAGVEHLQEMHALTELNLQKTSVTDGAVAELRKRLPNLAQVQVDADPLPRALRMAERLGGKTTRDESGTVSEINLKDTAAGDRHLVHLAAVASVKTLDLTGTAITDEGIQKLAALPQLDFLVTAQTQVTEAGLTRLKAKFPAEPPGGARWWMVAGGKGLIKGSVIEFSNGMVRLQTARGEVQRPLEFFSQADRSLVAPP